MVVPGHASTVVPEITPVNVAFGVGNVAPFLTHQPPQRGPPNPQPGPLSPSTSISHFGACPCPQGKPPSGSRRRSRPGVDEGSCPHPRNLQYFRVPLEEARIEMTGQEQRPAPPHPESPAKLRIRASRLPPLLSGRVRDQDPVEKRRAVLIDVTPTGVKFEFDASWKVGADVPHHPDLAGSLAELDDRGHALPSRRSPAAVSSWSRDVFFLTLNKSPTGHRVVSSVSSSSSDPASRAISKRCPGRHPDLAIPQPQAARSPSRSRSPASRADARRGSRVPSPSSRRTHEPTRPVRACLTRASQDREPRSDAVLPPYLGSRRRSS